MDWLIGLALAANVITVGRFAFPLLRYLYARRPALGRFINRQGQSFKQALITVLRPTPPLGSRTDIIVSAFASTMILSSLVLLGWLVAPGVDHATIPDALILIWLGSTYFWWGSVVVIAIVRLARWTWQKIR